LNREISEPHENFFGRELTRINFCISVPLLIHDMAAIVMTLPIHGEFKHRADDADERVTFERPDTGNARWLV
jgi:hypothetical protein